MIATTQLDKRPAGKAQTRPAPDESSPFSGKDWLLLLAVTVLGLILYFPMLGSFGPLDPTDSFFIESGREMVEMNSYVVPIDNYQPWLDKPILTFWIISGIYKVLGVSPFAGRLHSAISSVLLGLLLYAGTRPFLNRRASFLSAAIFLSFPLASIIGHVSLTDMPLALLITGAVLGIACGALKDSKKAFYLGYASLGLAVLNKGPIAFILCTMAFFAWVAISTTRPADWLPALKKLRPGLGCTIVAALNIPWYGVAMIHTHGAFFYDFFIRQNFGRVMGTVNHQEKWYFYIPIFFGGLCPWTLYLASSPAIYKRAWSLRHTSDNQARFFLLCGCWAVSVLALFGALPTKLPTYILPAFPAIATLMAMQVEALLRGTSAKHMLIFTVPGFIAATIFFFVHGRLHGPIGVLLNEQAGLLAFIALALGVHCVLLALNKTRTAIAFFAVAAAIATGMLVPLGLSTYHREHQVPFDRLVARTKADGARLAILIAEQPTAPYVLHRRVPRLTNRREAEDYLTGTSDVRYVVVPKEVLKDLFWFNGRETLIEKQGKWSLFALK